MKTYSTIKDMVCHLLTVVAFYEDRSLPISPENRVESTHPNARSVGLTYAHVSEEVLKQFPDSKTTPSAVRRIQGRIVAAEPYYNQFVLPNRRPRANGKDRPLTPGST